MIFIAIVKRKSKTDVTERGIILSKKGGPDSHVNYL